MKKRSRLVFWTLVLCSIPALLGAGILIAIRQNRQSPYVAGQERDDITRRLDRGAHEESSGIRFTDVTAPSGILFEHFPFVRTSQLPEDMGSGAAWGDYDGDGYPDLYLVNIAAPLGTPPGERRESDATDRLYRNRGDGSFVDVTTEAGVGIAHVGMGAAWGDYDADGDLDLFVTSWGENVLWDNLGDGTFRNVTEQAGLQGEGFWTGASWADFDLDGDLDLYVCGYVQYKPKRPGTMMQNVGDVAFPFTLNPSSYLPHPNRLFVNLGDGSFEDRAESAGVRGAQGRSLSAAWADFDADGLPDLYVANDVSDNHLYRNRGDGTFQDISYGALVADYRGAMGLAVGDWDGDLDLDLFVTHWIAQENALYSNMISVFEAGSTDSMLLFGDDANRVGLGQISLDLIGWGTALADFDQDGRLDIFVVNGSTFQDKNDLTRLLPMQPHLYWNGGAQKGFFEVGESAGIRSMPARVGRGAAFVDYDLDGDTDVLIMFHGGRAQLLRNDSHAGHVIGFELTAVEGHPSGRGTRLMLHSGSRSFLQEAMAGPSYLSQSSLQVRVGLGTISKIDSLVVTWPRGHREVWSNLQADRLWRLTEGVAPREMRAWITSSGNASSAALSRPTSSMSEYAVVSDVSSPVRREDKAHFWSLSRQASREFQDEQWAEAAETYASMSALDPQHEDALYYRGNSFLELEDLTAAKRCWMRLLEVNPSSSRAWVQIGILHTMPGEHYNLEEATAAFQNAHRINREQSRPLLLLGEVALAAKDFPAAQAALTAAHQMNAQSTAALYWSAYVYWAMGQHREAETLYQRAQQTLHSEAVVSGASNEGDILSDEMLRSRRKAEQRRLFGACLRKLREGQGRTSLKEAFSWVDQVLDGLPPQVQ